MCLTTMEIHVFGQSTMDFLISECFTTGVFEYGQGVQIDSWSQFMFFARVLGRGWKLCGRKQSHGFAA